MGGLNRSRFKVSVAIMVLGDIMLEVPGILARSWVRRIFSPMEISIALDIISRGFGKRLAEWGCYSLSC